MPSQKLLRVHLVEEATRLKRKVKKSVKPLFLWSEYNRA